MINHQEMLRKRSSGEITKRGWKEYLRKRRAQRKAISQKNSTTSIERERRRIIEWRKNNPPVIDLSQPESPIEMKLCNAMKEIGLMPICQYHVGLYRLDFAFPDCKLAIEADGHEFHSTKLQRTHDTVRQRALMRLGWQVVRFTGSEIHNSPAKCAKEVFEFYSQAVMRREE